MLSLCLGLGQHEALAFPSSVKICPLSTCRWTHKPHFKCRLWIGYAFVHHCLNLYKVLIWVSILTFLILSEHLAMTLWSREGLLSLSCWREVAVQRYSSARLWPQSDLRQNAVQDSQALCPFPQVVSYVTEGYTERAHRENYVDQNIVLVLFCPPLHYITVLWPCKPFPWCNVPSGPSILKADGCNSAYLEIDLWLLPFSHWQCQWVPNFLSVPP